MAAASSGAGVPMRGMAGLLPDRHPTADFFVCDISRALPKDDMATMEHPVFSLATRPDLRILAYAHNGVEITVTPSVRGLATIHDKDILIYCISQLMAALNAGARGQPHADADGRMTCWWRPTARPAATAIGACARPSSGWRARGSPPTSRMGGIEVTRGFGLIEAWEIVRKTRGGRMVSVSVTLSDWLYRAVLSKSVLTLSRDYFRLRKPLERRVYELARKHCGRQRDWRVSVDAAAEEVGLGQPPPGVPRHAARDDRGRSSARLPPWPRSRATSSASPPRAAVVEDTAPAAARRSRPEALEAARALAPGWDVYALEADWRGYWAASGRPRLRSAERAFLGYVRARAG